MFNSIINSLLGKEDKKAELRKNELKKEFAELKKVEVESKKVEAELRRNGKLKKVDELIGLGYKIYYKVHIDGSIEYDLGRAKKEMKFCSEFYSKSGYEKDMYQIIEKKNGIDLRNILRKYDYNGRAIRENAKCSVIYLPLYMEMIKKKHGKDISDKVCNSYTEFLEDFTTGRKNKRVGRCVNFADLVEVVKYTTHESVISDEFFNAAMDYIANIVLKYDM